MYFSRYNIFSKVRDSDNYFILNLLSGNADILSPEEASLISSKQYDKLPKLVELGYYVDEQLEKKLFMNKYLDFIDERDKDEVQLFFVTNYSCNFACFYCYQDEYEAAVTSLTTDVIDSCFEYVRNNFAGKRCYFTIFGGEPLLPSESQMSVIQYFLEKAKVAGIETCIVTNGYSLSNYIPILKDMMIREIQVTLDGTEAIHNERRYLKSKKGTFNEIVSGIDSCLAAKIPVNLRMVIDKLNVDNLPEFSEFAIQKAWTKNPLFKTQLGRNYELHHCQSLKDKLFSRIEMYTHIYHLLLQYPHIAEFYKPAFSVSKFVFEHGDLPDPLFDSCPACKTEWAFDYTGKIYPCTATVGKKGEELGSFYPTVSLNQAKVDDWISRDVTSISECKSCELQLACGGGCGSVAKNNKGSVCNPDCRPVKELLEMGFAYYFKE